MCCIMPAVDHVSDTNLFARLTSSNRQVLVYQMNYRAKQPVAMVLPIPVALPSAESAVRFLNLRDYPSLFENLFDAFPLPKPGPLTRSGEPQARPLAVENVGDFVASFVPSPQDFRRVNRRFQLPPATFEKLPQYRDYGFVVFQLREPSGTPHAMAFEFPTRLKDQLFFPTVHIHDGQIHEEEQFDHALYFQDGEPRGETSRWPAERYVYLWRAPGVFRGDAPLQRVKLYGTLPNTDTILSASPK